MAVLTGTWRLAEWSGRTDAQYGLLLLTDDGWFAVHVADTHETVVAEAGSYDVEGDMVAMSSEVSLEPQTVGTRELRRWRVQGELLELQWDGADTRWHRARDEVVDSMGG